MQKGNNWQKTEAKQKEKKTERTGVFRVLKSRDFPHFLPPYYFFSHKNHRPKLGRWFCVVGVLVSRLSKEERKRRRRRRTRNLGECRNERVFDGDCKKPTIFRKSEKREREKTSAVLKIRSKSSALFISFRLGAEKTSEPTTRVNSVLKARFYSRPKSPLLLPIRKNISKKKGLQTFESRLTLDDCVKSATTPFGKKDKTRKERENSVQRTT